MNEIQASLWLNMGLLMLVWSMDAVHILTQFNNYLCTVCATMTAN